MLSQLEFGLCSRVVYYGMFVGVNNVEENAAKAALRLEVAQARSINVTSSIFDVFVQFNTAKQLIVVLSLPVTTGVSHTFAVLSETS